MLAQISNEMLHHVILRQNVGYERVARLVVIFVVVAILAIFLYAFGYLGLALAFAAGNLDSTTFATIALLILIFLAIKFVLKGSSAKKEENK